MKFIVWIREKGGQWEPNSEGPFTRKTAERIAREIRRHCLPKCEATVLPEGVTHRAANCGLL